jgi:predicted MPP superfamily phosphohydrolase
MLETTQAVDYIEDIKVYLDSINVDYSDYDDDHSYYDGIDDVWTVTLNKSTYKFVQGCNTQYPSVFMSHDGDILHTYDEIVEYLKNHLI